MKAIYFEQTGDAREVLIYGEQKLPVVGDNDVLVRLMSSAVNPSDVKKRAGFQAPGFEGGFVIPHSDGAGVIEKVGRNVLKNRIGERVWVYQAQFGRHMGTAAQYIVVPQQQACLMPQSTSYEVGACVGIPMMTAHRCVHMQGGVKGQRVLVTGASGRVGCYAAQLAKLAGATVIATAGSAARCEMLVKTNADLILNYKEDDIVACVMEFTKGEGVNRIIDVEFGSNINISAQILAVNGVICSYSSSQSAEPVIPFYPLMFKNISIHTVLVYNMPDKAKQNAITDINNHLDNQNLKHRIAQIFDLSETAKAHEAIEQGGLDGCVVINISH